MYLRMLHVNGGEHEVRFRLGDLRAGAFAGRLGGVGLGLGRVKVSLRDAAPVRRLQPRKVAVCLLLGGDGLCRLALCLLKFG